VRGSEASSAPTPSPLTPLPQRGEGDRKPPKEIYQGRGGQWFLTTKEKKRILLNNIYGVDIDAQAVEVTKLSLLLKVLEHENQETLGRQLLIAGGERALPDLGQNIKCGNSLIGPDFYDGQQASFLDEEEKYRINVFDWHAEFPQIMKAGGFDAVIGNPPYIRIHRIGHEEADYLFGHYKGPASKTDLSLIFIERALSLAAPRGLVGFICTSQWLATDYGRNMRRMLSDGRLREIVDFASLPVFSKASTYPAIFILSPAASATLHVRRIRSEDELNLGAIEKARWFTVALEQLGEAPWSFDGFNLVKSMESRGVDWKPLRSFGKAYIGTKSGSAEAFVHSADEAKKARFEKDLLLPYAYQGAEVERYGVLDPAAVIIYPYNEGANGAPELVREDELRKACPRIHAHLTSQKDALRQRQDSRRFYAKGRDWYRHLRAGSFNYIRPPKLVVKGIAKRCEAGLMEAGTAFDGANCPAIIFDDLAGHDLRFFLGILNSKLATSFLRTVCPAKLSGYTRFSSSYIAELPIPSIDFTSPADKSRHDQMVTLVEQMLTLHRQLAAVKTPDERTRLERQIAATDQRIDRLVYELYGLTAAEIKIVEGEGGS
jgi:hypothetical protein